MVEANKKLVMRLISNTTAEKTITVDASSLGANKAKLMGGRSTKTNTVDVDFGQESKVSRE